MFWLMSSHKKNWKADTRQSIDLIAFIDIKSKKN